jgi:ribosomal protein S27E
MDEVIRCPHCGSTELDGEPGEQEPVILTIYHDDGTCEDVESFVWVDMRCRDCRHEWYYGPETTPAQEMEAAGAAGLFNLEIF